MRFISMGAHKLSMSSIFMTVWFFTVWNLTDYLAILLLKSIWIVSGLRILFSSFFWDITDIHCLNLRTTTQWFHNVYIAMYVLQNDGLGILLTMWPRPFLYTHSGPSACDSLGFIPGRDIPGQRFMYFHVLCQTVTELCTTVFPHQQFLRDHLCQHLMFCNF